MAQGAFRPQGGGPEEQGAHPDKSSTMEVMVHVATMHHTYSSAMGPLHIGLAQRHW